jgi:LPS-assembly protein
VRAILFALLLMWPALGMAQNAATLVADRLILDERSGLIASGHVEAFFGEARLQASELRYDRRTGRLSITGPITLQDGPNIRILASAAELDPQLQSGLLNGARMILNQQLRLNTEQIKRSQGRFTELTNPSVTSCKTCGPSSPLWQIKASKVIHDQQERRLYFYQARLLIKDVPILYVPRLRLPDPSVKRASGFLVPTLRTTSQLGTGVRLPYFLTLGPHRDLTITPYLSVRTKTVELRYRQAFERGDIDVDWALTRDTLRPGETRGFAFAQGNFVLSNEFNLDFGIESASDDTYLREYGFSSKDRLTNSLTLWRARPDRFVGLSALNFKSLRDGETNATLPTLVLDAENQTRHFPGMIGGEIHTQLLAHSHYRTSTTNTLGRDVNRLTAQADWMRNWSLNGGARLGAQLGTAVDVFNIAQDSGFDPSQTGITPYGAVSVRLPMQRATRTDQQFLEPVAQIGWAGDNGMTLPNEESTQVEFDEGNLFALSRFPRPDRRESGTFAAAGINWARMDSTGVQHRLSIGQIVRSSPDSDFSLSSGLGDRRSDLLIAGQLKAGQTSSLSARSLFNEGLSITKAELRGNWRGDGTSISGSYLWLLEDPAEQRNRDISELNLSGAFDLTRNWQANADWRFDLADERSATAGVGLVYNNECVTISLSVDRRYSTSTSLDPSTNLGFTVGLRGFSAQKGTERFARTCRK